jgi:hypothetical protein
MPAVFLGIFLNPAMQPVIIPAQHEQHSRGFLSHGKDFESETPRLTSSFGTSAEFSMFIAESPNCRNRVRPVKKGVRIHPDNLFWPGGNQTGSENQI